MGGWLNYEAAPPRAISDYAIIMEAENMARETANVWAALPSR